MCQNCLELLLILSKSMIIVVINSRINLKLFFYLRLNQAKILFLNRFLPLIRTEMTEVILTN
ncbi:hypothetical protein Oscil6304_1644 [Oscillatoria acuminata PCC 6304]|uniref:Uncharacterized protein n=1 Tax=Oscillatoria acuminata PCC 6304 TaxID=56110 RepID=K9TFM5_9CYAN|nr:hypothetical protein Oscil6304_1644 [Oscillatoria acuminata PCC 6304]